MIAGIVLAGGRSIRMGRPKATLAAGDMTFLERVVRTLSEGGCDEVVVVLNTEDARITSLASSAGATATRGGGADSEQVESLRAGLRALPRGVEAAVVLPVDHPLVQPATVAILIGAFKRGGAPVVRVSHAGRPGHPVLFSSAVFDELLEGDLPHGARTVIRAHAGALDEVEVEDAGVLVDVDTPGEYETHFGRPD